MNTDMAKAFRVIRAAHGLRQAELARRIGVSTSLLSLIERGKRQPSVRVIGALGSATATPTSLIMLLASSADELAHDHTGDLARALLSLLVRASKDENFETQLNI